MARPRTSPNTLVSGLATKLTDLEQAVARQAERFAALIEVGALISGARDIDHLLGTVMDRLTGLLPASAATLFMHDAASDELWSRVLKGTSLKELRVPVDKGLAGHVFSSGRTLMLEDAYADPRFNPEIDRLTGYRTRSVIATPLKPFSGRVSGVLQVLDSRKAAFTADDQALVEGVASQIAAVLDSVLLLEALKSNQAQLARRVHELDVLYEIERAISQTHTSQDLLDAILHRALESTGALAGSILLMSDDGDSLYFRNTTGAKADALRSMRLKPGQGIAGHVAQSSTVVRVRRAEDCEYFDRSIARKLGITTEAVLCTPVHADQRTLGALELLNKPGGFSDADEKLAVLLAGQIGRALDDRQTREDRERRTRLATIGQMLAGVLHDLRTPLTVIAGYAEMMASETDASLRAEMSRSIVAQLHTVNAMQQETLAFARGERNVLIRKVFMHLFMRDVSEQLLQEFSSSRADLKVQVGYTGAARFDENKIKRAIFNLARNAIEAMPDGGRFTLSVDREGPDLVFRASDTGPGIPDEIADRLFDSFVSGGKKDGTGLGLAIVKQIAREHQGSISFRSRAGKGTTFELRFPAGMGHD